MLREKKWFRVLLWTLGGIIGGLLVLLTAFYLILKSPAVQQKIVSSLKDPLAKEGVALDVKSLSIDLFAGVNLEGLTVTLKRAPQIEGVLGIEVLRLRYKFWPLLSRRLEIREAKISGVTGTMTLNLPPPQPEPPADPEALTRLVELLRNPPAVLELPELSLEKVSMTLNVFQDPMAVALEIRDMGLTTSLEVLKGRSSLNLNAEIPATVSFMKEALSLRTKVLLRPQLSWKSEINGQEFSWQLDLKGFRLDLDPTEFRQNPNLEAKFDQLPLTLDLALDHRGTLPEKTVTVLDLVLPLHAKGEAEMALGPLQFSDLKSKMQASLALTTQLDFEASLPRDLKRPEDANWVLDNSLNLKALELIQASKKTVSVPELSLALKGKGEKGQGTVDLGLSAQKMRLAALQSPLSLETLATLKIDLPNRALELLAKLQLNDKQALELTAKAKDQGNVLDANVDATIETHPAWRSLHPGLAQLDKLAWPRITLKNQTDIPHVEPLEEIKDWAQLPITSKLNLQLIQTNGRENALARFRDLKVNLAAKTQNKKASGDLKLAVEGLEHKAIKKSVAFGQDLAFKVDFFDLLKLNLEGQSRLDEKKLLDLKLDLVETPSQITLSDKLRAWIDPSLKSYVSGLEILDDVGAIELTSEDRLSVQYPEKRMREVKSWEPSRLKVQGELKQTVSQAPHAGKYKLNKPLVVLTNLKLDKNTLGAHTQISAPSVEARELLAVSNLSAKVTVGIQDVKEQKRVRIDASGGATSIDPLMQAAAQVKDLIRDARFALKADIYDKDRIVISDVNAKVDGTLLSFQGKGDMAIKTGRGGFVGFAKSVLPPGKTIAGLKGQGSFELPFTLTLYDKKVLAVNSEPTFKNISFVYNDEIEVQGLDGRISLSEELSIDDKQRIGFLYLNTQNPFTRVDFENIDPYLGQRLSLAIKKLRFKHIVAGPILTNFEVRQNLILLNEMTANLLEGSALGRVFIDLHPDRLQLGFLGRFSNLQLELLKESARRQGRTDELSGRAAANFDIRKRLATGRIDVTSIGRNQLLSMIDVLDPEYKDTQMMSARRALQVSYPSLVSISMEQGLMDLLIGLGGAVSTDINVRSIPLTAFINANAGESLMTIEKFLQTGGQ